MKSSIKMSFLGSLVLVAVVFTGPTEAVAQPGMHISFQTFYDELAPHGRWINNPQYGYVWQPYAEPGFQPYATRGHWVVTEYGNTWVSDYDWGWAPFHYGRWFYDDFYGWAWVSWSGVGAKLGTLETQQWILWMGATWSRYAHQRFHKYPCSSLGFCTTQIYYPRPHLELLHSKEKRSKCVSSECRRKQLLYNK